MTLTFVSLVFQALLIIHCIKAGKNQIWIWVLALLSFVGVIAYVAAELVPDLLRSRTTRKTVRGVRQVLDPTRDLRRLEGLAKVTGGVGDQQRYAEELLRQGRALEAIETYRQTLRGLYAQDPNLMLGLARAQFEADEFAAARATLDELIRLNPEFRSPQGHLLYARSLEAEGARSRALEEYKVLSTYFPGAEAAVRHAQLLRTDGRGSEAREVLQALLDQAAVAPAHYRRAQETWLKTAAREVEQD